MKVLIFSPFAGIWRHTILEAQFIQALSKSKEIEITSVGCGRLFPSDCTVRTYFRGSAPNTPSTSNKLCEKCDHARKIFSERTSARTVNLDDYADIEEEGIIDSMLLQPSNAQPYKFDYKGFQLGNKALYEIILKYKKRALNLNEKEMEEWKSIVKNSALVITPAIKILNDLMPDVVVMYNAQYAIPGTFADISVQQGVQTYNLAGSSSPVEAATAIRIWNWQKYKAEDPALYEWPGGSKLRSIKGKSLSRYYRHEKYISTGKSPWTYSQAQGNRNPYEFFEIPDNKSLVLAVLNSEDEIFAAKIAEVFPVSRTESIVFSSQWDWISYLIQFYKEKPDFHLIIRLHPREYPNKRENQFSEQATIWENLFMSLPPNIHLDHPKDRFSIYDYFPHIRILTTGWSSTGIEALARGIPVVTYDRRILGYPSEEILTGSSISDYKRNLELAESLGRSSKRIEFARKWINFSLFEGSVYLGGGIQDAPLRSSNPLFKNSLRILNRILNRMIPSKIKKFDLLIPRSRKDDKKLLNLIFNKKDNLYQT